jgi:hypothetical protein
MLGIMSGWYRQKQIEAEAQAGVNRAEAEAVTSDAAKALLKTIRPTAAEMQARFESLHNHGTAIDLIVDGKIKHVELRKFLVPAPTRRGPDNGSAERMQVYHEPG